jgi:hypothetical protein
LLLSNTFGLNFEGRQAEPQLCRNGRNIPKISFLKLQGRGLQIYPRDRWGWMV